MHVVQVVVGLTVHLHLLIWEVPTVGEVLLLAQPNLLSPLFKLNLILVDEHISVVWLFGRLCQSFLWHLHP